MQLVLPFGGWVEQQGGEALQMEVCVEPLWMVQLLADVPAVCLSVSFYTAPSCSRP